MKGEAVARWLGALVAAKPKQAMAFVIEALSHPCSSINPVADKITNAFRAMDKLTLSTLLVKHGSQQYFVCAEDTQQAEVTHPVILRGPCLLHTRTLFCCVQLILKVPWYTSAWPAPLREKRAVQELVKQFLGSIYEVRVFFHSVLMAWAQGV